MFSLQSIGRKARLQPWGQKDYCATLGQSPEDVWCQCSTQHSCSKGHRLCVCVFFPPPHLSPYALEMHWISAKHVRSISIEFTQVTHPYIHTQRWNKGKPNQNIKVTRRQMAPWYPLSCRLRIRTDSAASSWKPPKVGISWLLYVTCPNATLFSLWRCLCCCFFFVTSSVNFLNWKQGFVLLYHLLLPIHAWTSLFY